MKILACINIRPENVIQEWDLEGEFLIISKLKLGSIAIRLDKSRIKSIGNPQEFAKQVEQTLPQAEHFEALIDTVKRAYLGSLNFADAEFRPNDSN